MSSVTTFDDNVNRSHWVSFTDIIDAIIHHEGLIFGGAVRDIILRDKAAESYYEFMGASCDSDIYTNTEIHPESKDRVMIPNDIDATIHHSKFDDLMQTLTKMKYTARTLFKRDAKKYLPNLTANEGDIMHHKIILRPMDILTYSMAPAILKLFKKEFAAELAILQRAFSKHTRTIMLDIMVIMNDTHYDPPFGNLDFECNGLVQDKHGIRLSKHLLSQAHFGHNLYRINDPMRLQRQLLRIQTDIINKIARTPSDTNPINVDNYRVIKIKSKGFSIHYESIKRITDSDEHAVTDADESTCIICHESFEKKDHFKLACCAAKYHAGCLIKACSHYQSGMIHTQRCLMCRRDISHNIIPDIALLTRETSASESLETL